MRFIGMNGFTIWMFGCLVPGEKITHGQTRAQFEKLRNEGRSITDAVASNVHNHRYVEAIEDSPRRGLPAD
jgi:hypothetical protein